MRTIYNGVEARRFYERRAVFKSETVKILISGRVTQKKGQMILLEALNLVKQAGIHNFECHILGPLVKKAYANELLAYIKANRMEQFVFLDGFSDRTEEWLKTSDILCMCSTKEAFGLTTIEGMLSGCLVIGADTGATPEIIQDGETGLLYAYGENGGADGLAKRLIWAIINPDKAAQIALKGQAHALQHYDSDITYREIVQLYEDLLRNP